MPRILGLMVIILLAVSGGGCGVLRAGGLDWKASSGAYHPPGSHELKRKIDWVGHSAPTESFELEIESTTSVQAVSAWVDAHFKGWERQTTPTDDGSV